MDKKVLENIRQSLLDIYRMEVIDGIRDILSGENSFLLLLLSCSSSPLTASFMAERLNITKGRITALISSLLDKEDIEITLNNYFDEVKNLPIFHSRDGGRPNLASPINKHNLV